MEKLKKWYIKGRKERKIQRNKNRKNTNKHELDSKNTNYRISVNTVSGINW